MKGSTTHEKTVVSFFNAVFRSVLCGRQSDRRQKRFRIPKKDVIAFGDGGNDFEMLLEAGEAYAMKDSPSSKLIGAFPKTEFPSTEDGVARQLQKVLSNN